MAPADVLTAQSPARGSGNSWAHQEHAVRHDGMDISELTNELESVAGCERQGACWRGWHSFGHRAFRNPSMNRSIIY